MYGLLVPLSQYFWIFSLAVSLIVATILYVSHRAEVDFWLMNAGYGFPVLGKLHRLARSRQALAKNGFLHSEDTLCHDYEKHIKFLSKAEFDRRLEYLRKAQDNGRTPVPLWLIAVLVVLVAAEGYGFSYLLAPFVAIDISENARQIVSLAIVIVLCIVLVFLTHYAGLSLYVTRLIERCETDWDEKNRVGDLGEGIISLNDDTKNLDGPSIDDFDSKGKPTPSYKQCINRVGRDKKWTVIVGVVSFVVAVGVAQVIVRMYEVQRAEIADTAGLPTSSQPTSQTTSEPLPDFFRNAEQQADRKAVTDQNMAQTGEWLVGSLALLFIYLLTQAVGFITGYSYGFAGKDSLAAYRATRGSAAYHEYHLQVDQWIGAAEARLSALQQNIQNRIGASGMALDKTFTDYLGMVGNHRVALQNIARASTTHVPDLVADGRIISLVNSVDGMDATEAKDFVKSLPLEDRRRVQVALRRKKEDRDAQQNEASRALDEDLDDVLDG